jgi:hypothetical protein
VVEAGPQFSISSVFGQASWSARFRFYKFFTSVWNAALFYTALRAKRSYPRQETA